MTPAGHKLRIRTAADMEVGGEMVYAGYTTSTQLSAQLAERWDIVTLY